MNVQDYVPRGIAVTFCHDCNRVAFADHVSREDQIPRRYCYHCGKLLAVLIYGYERALKVLPP